MLSIESDPFCETNLSHSENNIFEADTHIWMRCTVNVRGSWTPTLEWRLHGCNGETDEETTDLTALTNVVIVPNVNISSTLTIPLNTTSNSSYYSCKIYFSSVSKIQTLTANNTPNYTYIWNSPLVTSFPKTLMHSTQRNWMITNDSAKNMKDSSKEEF